MKKRLLAVVFALFLMVSQQSAMAAIVSPEQQSLYQEGVTYFDTCQTSDGSSDTCGCDQGSASTTSVNLNISGPSQWTASVSPPYYVEQFSINVLEDIAQTLKLPTTDTVTQQHVLALVAWAWAEGGNINNTNAFNLWNMGFLSNYPQLYVGGGGAADGSSDSFVSFDAGVEAFAIEMTSAQQNRIGSALSDSTSSAQQVLAAIANYQDYQGNSLWATKTGYGAWLQENLNQAERDYSQEASVIIGPGQDGKDQHVSSSELQYQNGSSGSGTVVTTSSDTGGCSSSSTSASCGTGATGDAEILCEAEQYAGIYYLWGGGNDGYSNFRQACPISNISSAASSSTSNNPGPCATDCSGLVTVALDQAFNQNLAFTVLPNGMMGGDDVQYWQQIPISQAQPGDIVTRADSTGHVEIVESISNGVMTSFGSHGIGIKTGSDTNTISAGFWVYAFHWVGPGSGVST